MAVPTQLSDLNVSIASNPPAATDSTGSPGQLDDYLRAAYGLLAQVNAAKAPLASPTFTGDVVLPATTQIGSGAPGDVVTSTELGYLNGVTSAIQTQITAKANAADPAFTGTPSGVIVGGTYTPTLTNTTNVSSSEAAVCQYMRVGPVVTVSGRVTIEATATAATVLKISLPVASNLADTNQLAGTGTNSSTGRPVCLVHGDATANTASLEYVAGSTGASYAHFTFTYLIV